MKTKFKLIKDRALIGGVCSGIAYFLGTNTWIVRLLFIIFSSFLLWPYILVWILAPRFEKDPIDYSERCE